MHTKYSPEELQVIETAAALLNRHKLSNVFGDISGVLQKVLDFIEIQSFAKPGETIDLSDPEKHIHIKGSEYLSPIISAIKDNSVIRIYYQPFYEDKPYFADIHPYLLKEYKGRWYLIGLNDFRGQLRTYALDRIHDLQSSDLKYRAGNLNAPEYFRYSIGVISPEGIPQKTVIAVQKTQAQYLISQPWHMSQNIEEENEDEVMFSFRVHPTYEFISLLLSLGKDVRILEPISLRKKILEEITAMLTQVS